MFAEFLPVEVVKFLCPYKGLKLGILTTEERLTKQFLCPYKGLKLACP